MAKSERGESAPESFRADRFDELHDLETDLFDAGVWSSSDEPGEKEGLPSQYTMSHDAHYVDELVSARPVRQAIRVPVNDIWETGDAPSRVKPLADSIAEFGVLQPLIVRRRHSRYELIAGARRLAAAKAAGLTDVPCLLYDVDDRQAERLREATNLHVVRGAHAMSDSRALLRYVLPLLGQSLQTINACLLQLSGSRGSLPSRVASQLISSEAQQATRLAWGAMLASLTPTLTLSDFDAADVLDEVLRTYHKEHILTELEFDKRVHSLCMLRADRRLVSVAIRGVVDAMVPLARTRREARVAVRLARDEPSRMVVLQVSQDILRPPDSDWNRWFDLGWRERPGGIVSGVGLLAAKRVAELHGGSISITPLQGRGCLLTLCLPAAPHLPQNMKSTL